MKKNIIVILLLIGSISCQSANKSNQDLKENEMESNTTEKKLPEGLDTATLGNGCFWCTEAVFDRLIGVYKVTSGYSGGKVKNPTYREVCTGLTEHAECLQILYNPKEVSYEDILNVFFATHDPTTLNRQGNDNGTQYRSVIFHHSPAQKQTAEKVINELTTGKVFSDPIVTQIGPSEIFYPAETYHQDYFARNSSEPYCRAVVRPKVEKFEKLFKEKMKKGY
jgi:peptide-methionine (S)-S-oxide reductase